MRKIVGNHFPPGVSLEMDYRLDDFQKDIKQHDP